MGAGLGIVLLILGAIVVFTDFDTKLVAGGLDTVGWILMAGGVLAIILALVMNRQRANTRHTAIVDSRSIEHDVVDERRTPRERDDRGI